MLLAIPNTKVTARIFEPVKTEDPQYNIVDLGVQYEDGGIDSLAVGGSFYSLKKAVKQNNSRLDESGSVKPDASDNAVDSPEPGTIVNYDGVEQGIDSL